MIKKESLLIVLNIILIIILILLTKYLYIQIFNPQQKILTIVALPDDDLLYFNPDIYKYIKTNRVITTIYLTSGDAGEDYNYWHSREEGIKTAYASMANKDNSWKEKYIIYLNKYKIAKYSLSSDKNINLIFLRLPDGNFVGEGYPKTKYQSLIKLWLNEIQYIRTVDNINIYTKEELIKLLEEIISSINPDIINIQDVSNYKSSGDHSDHYATAYFSLAALRKLDKTSIKIFSYLGNVIGTYKKNLNPSDITKKRNFFFIYLNYDPLAKKSLNLYTPYLTRQYKKEINIINKNLPPLYTYKNKILNEKTHTPMILKGVTTQFFGYSNYNFEKFKQIYQIFKGKNINIIGCFINLEDTENKIEYLDWLINQSEKDHIYVYLTPTIYGWAKNPYYYAKRFPLLMEKMAKRYGKKTNVLYGVWAEPHDITTDQYLKLINETMERVRKHQPKAIIIINGMHWGNYFESIFEIIKNYKNVILSFHYYIAAEDKELKLIFEKNKVEFPWEKYTNKLPIIIGEFGGVWKKYFSSDLDLKFINETLKNINKYKLSYTFYTIDNDRNGLGLIDHQTLKITKKGQLLIDDITQNPPTNL